MVDRNRGLGQQRRVAIGVGGDEASDAHSLGGLGHRRLQRPALVDRAVSGGAANRRQVVEVPQVVEAGLVGDAPDRAQRLDRDVLPRCLQPEAEWMRHQWKRGLRTRMGYLYFSAKSSTDMPRLRIWLRYLRRYARFLWAGGCDLGMVALPEARTTSSPASSVLRCSSTLGFSRTWRTLIPGCAYIRKEVPSHRYQTGTACGRRSRPAVTSQIAFSRLSRDWVCLSTYVLVCRFPKR